MLFATKDMEYWDKINDRVVAVRTQIGKEVRKCVEDAKKAYMERYKNC
jgi:hypothetical protein